MSPNLIEQGLNLMLYGMGTVFGFLTVLVFATLLMSALVRKFGFSDSALEQSTPTETLPMQTPVSPQIKQAIQKAIAAHRQA